MTKCQAGVAAADISPIKGSVKFVVGRQLLHGSWASQKPNSWNLLSIVHIPIIYCNLFSSNYRFHLKITKTFSYNVGIAG